MSTGLWIFAALVFGAVFLLAQGLMVPVFGEARATRKRLKHRLDQIARHGDHQAIQSLLREKYLRELSPIEKQLESLPFMPALAQLIEQAGLKVLAYRLVLGAAGLALLGGAVGWSATRLLPAAALGALIGAILPFGYVLRKRAVRLARFEEQMPEAIDVLRRALKAGHPFGGALKLVSEDMDDPIAREFAITFADINYGNDVRRAMLGLLQRVPSVSVMAFVTAVLVQKETGGNLAEILNQIAQVIRGRFRFYRRVRTLSAEGRLSGWILTLLPLALFAALQLVAPDYLPRLIDDPQGQRLIAYAALMVVVGIFWMRRIIRIDV